MFKKIEYKPGRILFLTVIINVLMITGCDNGNEAQPDRIFTSPYSDLNWENVTHHDSEFHTHPGLGNEDYDPHQTVDRYHEEGYQILTLAAHSMDVPTDHISSIYPWTELSQLYETIKHVKNPRYDMTYEEIHNEPWEDRDPVELEMVSVEGTELSFHHHIMSVFNLHVDDHGLTEMQSLEKVQEHGGLAYFAHPGRYVKRSGLTAHWYVDLYKRYDILLGQAIYNRRDSWPGDRAFYDKVQHLLGGAERPIWLYGEDDMHRESTLGWNRDVILLENFQPGSLHPSIQDGSAPDVMAALKNGHSYLWKPSSQYNPRAFNIINVEIIDDKVTLTIDNEELVNEIRWRTHNPTPGAKFETISTARPQHRIDSTRVIIEATETVHHGLSITTADVPNYARFVRAEIEGDEGTIYTQPFYLIEE